MPFAVRTEVTKTWLMTLGKRTYHGGGFARGGSKSFERGYLLQKRCVGRGRSEDYSDESCICTTSVSVVMGIQILRITKFVFSSIGGER